MHSVTISVPRPLLHQATHREARNYHTISNSAHCISCALSGNRHLLRCDDMWKNLLWHLERKRCIANAKQFLASRNRVIDIERRQQRQQQIQQQMPYTAREQQFRYPRQQAQQPVAANSGQRTGYNHGEQRPRQGYRQAPQLGRDSPKPKQDT